MVKRFSWLLAFLTACLIGDSVGPSQADAHGLHLSLTVLPETVTAGEEFNARLTVTNPTADTVLMSGSGCLAFLGYAGGSKSISDGP